VIVFLLGLFCGVIVMLVLGWWLSAMALPEPESPSSRVRELERLTLQELLDAEAEARNQHSAGPWDLPPTRADVIRRS
jgi:hypothetical protein